MSWSLTVRSVASTATRSRIPYISASVPTFPVHCRCLHHCTKRWSLVQWVNTQYPPLVSMAARHISTTSLYKAQMQQVLQTGSWRRLPRKSGPRTSLESSPKGKPLPAWASTTTHQSGSSRPRWSSFTTPQGCPGGEPLSPVPYVCVFSSSPSLSSSRRTPSECTT